MKERQIKQKVVGEKAVDGAGVRLVRVLGNNTIRNFDPFLMLDSFDSVKPEDYTAGFPMHPHRGIETITYLIKGKIDHEDSLGNKGVIREGECQWMTAGSGILHQEMPRESDRMLGFQLWLNLPQKNKMTEPAYMSITKDMITRTKAGSAEIAVLSGSFGGKKGVLPKYIPASIYDIILPKNEVIKLPTKQDENVFVFTILGDIFAAGEHIAEKTAVLFKDGDYVNITAPAENDVRFIFFSAKALNESVAWGGPIVMNTKEELAEAFSELNEGIFIKHK
ncbi:pirin family protein [Pectinatus haikarae]|uniref:pirin family protein n=1 Tax=Pectinatus haikarae TaxID=349096 RepID=UPI001E4D84E4|nr:pirin family protein [Pectinatus haikarae]